MIAFWPAPANANHEQDHGASFDHRGGNEWWVEVQMAGVDFRFWHPMVKDDNSDWVSMEQPSWAPDDGYFVKSFHIEPGHEVRFKLVNRGISYLSCYFSHPDGTERCDGSETFTVEWDNARGNEWWVESDLESSQPLHSVWAQIYDTGNHHKLEQRSWGSWAGSFYVPEDQLVQFLAQSDSTGDWVESDCYRWPAAETVECPPPEFRTSFNDARGDASWFEVDLFYSHGEIARVDARVDWGPWQPLEEIARTSRTATWGGPLEIPDGGLVEARAVAKDGQIECSAQAYRWVPEPGQDAERFPDFPNMYWGNDRGNEWWVQTSVLHDQDIIVVQASVEGGPWQNLEERSWCDWAASIHVEPGEWVTFRAVREDSSTWGGGTLQWPPADPEPRLR